MGRLSLVIVCGLVASCDDPGKPLSGTRSEQIAASTSATSTASVATEAHSSAMRAGALCDPPTEGRSLSKSAAAFVDATGGVSDRAMPTWDGKRGRWVSFFASWCGPCKEELPRIQRFAKKLEGDGVPVDVEYLSIDDDLRQLTAFLAAQPEGGMKSSYWLKDGPPRTAWLASLKMKSDPPLPQHAIFDGKGKLRCFVSGAIEESDYPQLVSSLR
jgi:thiol-disulfide isomerase/thioredoxin